MKGTEGAMLKKKFPYNDLHHNSNIIIQMDDKPRLKSLYMKKYVPGPNQKNVDMDSLINGRPAGTLNFLRNTDQDPTLG